MVMLNLSENISNLTSSSLIGNRFDHNTSSTDGEYHQFILSVYDIETSTLKIETDINLMPVRAFY